MSTTFTIVAMVIGITIAVIAQIIKNNKITKKSPKQGDPYNGFHLGEMTSHDIPADVAKRERDYAKWSARQAGKSAESEKKEDVLWKRKQ